MMRKKGGNVSSGELCRAQGSKKPKLERRIVASWYELAVQFRVPALAQLLCKLKYLLFSLIIVFSRRDLHDAERLIQLAVIAQP